MFAERYQDRLDRESMRVYRELRERCNGNAPDFQEVRNVLYNWFDITYDAMERAKTAIGRGHANSADAETICHNIGQLFLHRRLRRPVH